MRVLIDAVKRENRTRLQVHCFIFLLGIVLVGCSWSKNILLVLLSLGVTILGIKMLWEAFSLRQVDDSPLLDLIFQHPNEIVWVYPVITDHMPFGLQFNSNVMIHFRLRNGDVEKLSISADQKSVIMKELIELLPRSTFGYSKEKETIYLDQPERLYKKDPQE